MAFKFYSSVAKGLKLKVRKSWGIVLTFVEAKGEKLVGEAFIPPITNRVNKWKKLQVYLKSWLLILSLHLLVQNRKHRHHSKPSLHFKLWEDFTHYSDVFIFDFEQVKLLLPCPWYIPSKILRSLISYFLSSGKQQRQWYALLQSIFLDISSWRVPSRRLIWASLLQWIYLLFFVYERVFFVQVYPDLSIIIFVNIFRSHFDISVVR